MFFLIIGCFATTIGSFCCLSISCCCCCFPVCCCFSVSTVVVVQAVAVVDDGGKGVLALVADPIHCLQNVSCHLRKKVQPFQADLCYQSLGVSSNLEEEKFFFINDLLRRLDHTLKYDPNVPTKKPVF